MKLSNIIFEGFRAHTSTVNGETYSTDWLGKADTLGDFKKAIDRMPSTIESINFPINTAAFKTSQDSKKIKPEGSWKSDVITTVGKVVREHIDNGEILEGININSYYGTGPKGSDNHPIYIQVLTKQSKKFADDMGSGKYGSLD